MAKIEVIQQRIRERLDALNLTARGVSLKATGKVDAINNILNKNATPTYERLEAIAKELGCSINYLTGTWDTPAADLWDVAVGANPVATSSLQRDLPVYRSSVIPVTNAPNSPSGAIHIGSVIQFFYRPPSLMTNKRAYATYVPVGTAAPALEIGQAIIVDPLRPAAMRDMVVLYPDAAADPEGWSPAPVFFGRLQGHSETHVEIEIFSPPTSVRVSVTDYTAIHRIVPLGELLGNG